VGFDQNIQMWGTWFHLHDVFLLGFMYYSLALGDNLLDLLFKQVGRVFVEGYGCCPA
jgi:hypothetical protein